MTETYPDPVRMEWKVLASLRAESPSIGVKELALRVGRSEQTIRVWLRKPLYQAYENWVFEQAKACWEPYSRGTTSNVNDTLGEYAQEMLERLRDIAESTQDEKLQAQVSQDWLDRAGYAPLRKINDRPQQVVLTAEAVRVLLERARESYGTVVVGESVPLLAEGSTSKDQSGSPS